MKTISILGATGSVGQSTLDLICRNPERFQVVALTAKSDVPGLADAVRRTGARFAAIADDTLLDDLRDALAGTDCEIAAGEAALIDAAAGDAEWVMAAIVGCAGLRPVMAAVESGKTLALANKEALVTAGALMIEAACRNGATILPVDSEHNAIFQCLAGNNIDTVERLILTASGGPFRTATMDMIRSASPAQAVAHPNWDMGAKISVDSATLMNKGLELIEAQHLFGLPADRLDVVVHPQSVIHSMVEFVDGSVLAQLGDADMRVPIAHTLAWPDRMKTPAKRLDLADIGRLDFERPDTRRFPALRVARAAMEEGGCAPVRLNAANEVAVAAFLDGRIGFLAIAEMVERLLDRTKSEKPSSIDEVIAIDRETRQSAGDMIEEISA